MLKLASWLALSYIVSNLRQMSSVVSPGKGVKAKKSKPAPSILASVLSGSLAGQSEKEQGDTVAVYTPWPVA